MESKTRDTWGNEASFWGFSMNDPVVRRLGADLSNPRAHSIAMRARRKAILCDDKLFGIMAL